MPAADEDIVRDLMHRCTEQVMPPASIIRAVVSRQRRRDRRVRVAAVATAGTALGTAAGVLALTPGAAGHQVPAALPGIRLTADQRELGRLSTAAASQPASAQRYAVMMTEGSGVKDTSVIDSLNGDLWSYQRGSGGSPSGTGFTRHYSPTSAQFAAMPASPEALRAALISQWDAQTEPPASSARRIEKLRHLKAVPQPLRITVSADDKVFQQASYLLWNPLVGPALRSALYRVLASVPGVTVSPAARDGLGRPAVEVSRTDDSGYSGGRSDGITYATYESPVTGAVLESTVTYPPGSDVVTPQDPHGTSVITETEIYVSVTWASTVPPDPYAS
jgi:hypothetical protein